MGDRLVNGMSGSERKMGSFCSNPTSWYSTSKPSNSPSVAATAMGSSVRVTAIGMTSGSSPPPPAPSASPAAASSPSPPVAAASSPCSADPSASPPDPQPTSTSRSTSRSEVFIGPPRTRRCRRSTRLVDIAVVVMGRTSAARGPPAGLVYARTVYGTQEAVYPHHECGAPSPAAAGTRAGVSRRRVPRDDVRPGWLVSSRRAPRRDC